SSPSHLWGRAEFQMQCRTQVLNHSGWSGHLPYKRPEAGSPLALRWVLMRSSRARRFARRCLDAELKQHDCKTCLPTSAQCRNIRYIERAMLLFQRGLLHNLRLGIAPGESGIYAKITSNAPHRTDVITKNFFG